MRTFMLAAAILVGVCIPVLGQESPDSADRKQKFFYEWSDDAGTLHITDNPGKVPEQYRSRVRTREVPKEEDRPGPSRPVETRSPSIDQKARKETAEKAEWQQRLRDWKQRLVNAEHQYADLKRERDELFRAWGSAALAPIENRLKAENIERQMQDVKQEIDRARNMLETVLPEEARKSGVPPGWLRE